MPSDRAIFTVKQGQRIAAATRWHETHGRTKIGTRRDYQRREPTTPINIFQTLRIHFAVLVKANGSNGAGPLYDLYDLADTGYAKKLNLAGALAPGESRVRWQTASPPIASPDGSEGTAFYRSGAIKLDTCPETLCTA